MSSTASINPKSEMINTKEFWNDKKYKTLVEIKCKYCNILFYIPISINKKKNRTCCSRGCSNRLKNELYGNPATWITSRKKMSEYRKGKIPWQKILGNDHPRVIQYKKDRQKQMSEMRRGNPSWNKGLTKEDPRVYKNTKYFRENNPIRNNLIKKKDTKIEISLQEELIKRNIIFERHKSIFGLPDIFINPNICIFADGCYWHNCPKCKITHRRERNNRDEEVNKYLSNNNYKVLRFWEHKINEDISSCVDLIQKIIKENDTKNY